LRSSAGACRSLYVYARRATIAVMTVREARWLKRLMAGEAVLGAVAFAGGVWLVALSMALLMIAGYGALKKRGP
jgi:hypothetical protein